MTHEDKPRSRKFRYGEDASTWTRWKPKVTHSPAPFSCFRNKDEHGECFDIYAAGNDRLLVSVYFSDDPNTSSAARAEADADLFTAAPQLLAALRSADLALSAALGRDYDGSRLERSIRQAINRADGHDMADEAEEEERE